MADILITHDMLVKLAKRSAYASPADTLIFFGFRGMLPLDIAGTKFAAAHKARLVSVNHQQMRCTLGQWRPGDGTVALFPGSTIPHMTAVQAARANNGIGANMLMLGKYRHIRGVHKDGKPSGHRAFRQNMFFPVWRTADDTDFDLRDRLDLSGVDEANYPWDNLHCAFQDNVESGAFSSNGCQVVAGRPAAPHNSGKVESGPWKRFIDNAYGPAAGGQTKFVYLLFSGLEAGVIAENPDGPVNRSLRFGSEGPLVGAVQKALKGKGFGFLEPDEQFGRDTLEALMAFQAMHFGKGQADGVIGPNTASALGVDWPKISFTGGTAAPFSTPTDSAAMTSVPPAWHKAAVAITPRFENSGDPYEGVTGNIDKMGISLGALQWNIGQDSLQPMVVAAGKANVLATMPTLGADMWKAVTSDKAVGLAIVNGWQSGATLSAVARKELKAMIGSPAMRAEQDKAIGTVADKALAMAAAWAKSAGRPAPSLREFAWFFDMVTQNGSLKNVTFANVKAFIDEAGAKGAVGQVCDFMDAQSGNSGHVKDAKKNAALWRGIKGAMQRELLVLTLLRSALGLPEWRHVVINRKGSIAMAGGWVNGSQHDFSGVLSG